MDQKELEESQRVDHVRDVVDRLKSTYKVMFLEELDLGLIKQLAIEQVSSLKGEFLKEGISHLFSKSDFNPSDLFRLIKLLEEPKPEPIKEEVRITMIVPPFTKNKSLGQPKLKRDS